MGARFHKIHFHKCTDCSGKITCYDKHSKEDFVGQLCDECLRKIVEEMKKSKEE